MSVGISFWELLTEKIERDPAVLHIALENITRWQATGHSAPQRLEQWRKLLQQATASAEGFQRLLAVLGATDSASVRLRDFHPFAGILTREERRQARELCGYRH